MIYHRGRCSIFYMRNLDCGLTLIESAQVFHWQEINGSYAAVVNGRILTPETEDNEAARYFDDARDYDSIKQKCGNMPLVIEAINKLPGLRVLNQPVWEALIAFILSANNNVKRIRQNVLSLNRLLGDKFTYNGEELYGFPEPKALMNVDPMLLKDKVRCGYRTEYLVKTAKMVYEGFPLEELCQMPVDEAWKQLMRLSGVGPKVADCVLLFGCGHTEAFPVDVWVNRLMQSWFNVSGSRESIRREARNIFGDCCGLVQQYLFHAARTGLISLKLDE